MTLAEKTLHAAVRTVARLFGQTEDERLQAIDRRQRAKDKLRKLAIWRLTYGLALALLSGCSAREALREIRDNARVSVYAIDHPRHGHCREVSLTSSSATAGESGAVYAGLCSHSIDAGAAADAAVGE